MGEVIYIKTFREWQEENKLEKLWEEEKKKKEPPQNYELPF